MRAWYNFWSNRKTCFIYRIRHDIIRFFDQVMQVPKSPSKNTAQEESLSHVDARYPAMLFKQQLTACLEKIFGLIRDNLKREISPLLSLCIQVSLAPVVDCIMHFIYHAMWFYIFAIAIRTILTIFYIKAWFSSSLKKKKKKKYWSVLSVALFRSWCAFLYFIFLVGSIILLTYLKKSLVLYWFFSAAPFSFSID